MKKIVLLLVSLLSCSVAFSQSAESPPGYKMPVKADVSKIPATYAFSWTYKMKMGAGAGKGFTAEYLLQPGADYFGMQMPQGMTMIMDRKRNISVTSFGKGMARASELPDYSRKAADPKIAKFTYKAIAGKTILGYACKGMQATNDKYTMQFYYTNDAPVSFGDMFSSQRGNNMPDALSGYFKPGEKPLVLEMRITEKASKKTTTMTCVGLEKSAYTFKKSDYKFM